MLKVIFMTALGAQKVERVKDIPFAGNALCVSARKKNDGAKDYLG